MARRPHHDAVLSALRDLDGALFREAECFFGGGTAIVLSLDEYRQSVDIGFLSASQPGCRRLRQAVWDGGFAGLARPGARTVALRDMRADQYGIRTLLEADGTRIKFEIIREARLALDGEVDPDYGVPVVAREDMYAEKLLANADRWADRSTLSRDILDLSVMISLWGDVPQAAWNRAWKACGSSVEEAFAKAVDRIRDSDWLETCISGLDADPALASEVLAVHEGPKPRRGRAFDRP